MPNKSCGTGWTMLGGRPRNSSWRGANGTSSRTRFGSFAEQAAKADELVDEAAALVEAPIRSPSMPRCCD